MCDLIGMVIPPTVTYVQYVSMEGCTRSAACNQAVYDLFRFCFSIICFHYISFYFLRQRYLSGGLLKNHHFTRYLLVNQQCTCNNDKNNLATCLYFLYRLTY